MVKSPKSIPVTPHDLVPALTRIWHDGLSKAAGRGPARIGVCVSGGPDSMALAYLLKNVPKAEPALRIEPVALIVDHDVRRGSRVEALTTAQRLKSLGIASIMARMSWSDIGSPRELSDFETEARSLRYQIIARSALWTGLEHIFTGHHQDDQVETILMRLARYTNTSFLGLQGMAEQTTVPCCEHIRGVSEAVPYENLSEWIRHHNVRAGTARESTPAAAERANLPAPAKDTTVTMSRHRPLQVHRPLLRFSKAQLMETCRANGIPYVLDETNDDPTVTWRNAIRHLRKHHHLPPALQATSILAMNDWARDCQQVLVNRGTVLLTKCRVKRFDLRSGAMTVSFATEFLEACEHDHDAAANALARLTGAVSCQPKDATPVMVSEANVRRFLDVLRSTGAAALDVQQVHLKKLHADSASAEDVLIQFSRPPMRASERDGAMTRFARTMPGSTLQTISFAPAPMCSADDSPWWSDWALWDHRYWIRIKPGSRDALDRFGVRPYNRDDAETVIAMLDEDARKRFRRLLAAAAPGKLRYTLPLVTYNGRPYLFPTLNFAVDKACHSAREHDATARERPLAECQVCYKAIDQGFVQDHVHTIEWQTAPRA